MQQLLLKTHMSKGSVLLAGLRNISRLPMLSGMLPSMSLLLRLR